MQVQRHSRIAHIRKISTYLRKWLTFLLFVPPLFYVVVAIFLLFHPTGHTTLVDLLADQDCQRSLMSKFDQGFTMQLKLGFVGFLSLFVIAGQFVIFHLRELAAFYSEGDIFNPTAVRHAKKAVSFTACIALFSLLTDVFLFGYALMYINGGNGSRFWDLLETGFDTFFLIGFLYVSLWALEIGADQHQESELTI